MEWFGSCDLESLYATIDRWEGGERPIHLKMISFDKVNPIQVKITEAEYTEVSTLRVVNSDSIINTEESILKDYNLVL